MAGKKAVFFRAVALCQVTCGSYSVAGSRFETVGGFAGAWGRGVAAVPADGKSGSTEPFSRICRVFQLIGIT